MLLKHYLARGVSKSELSRRFGVSRRTIHEWVVTGQSDRDLSSGGSRYSPRPPLPHKLDPYTGSSILASRSFPSCRRSGCLTRSGQLATRVATAGCGTTSGRHVRVRPPSRWCASRCRRGIRAGGLRELLDAAGPTICPGGGAEPLPAAVAELLPSADDGAVLTAGLESAFARFGGVPKELLFDQMGAVVSMGIENVPLFGVRPWE